MSLQPSPVPSIYRFFLLPHNALYCSTHFIGALSATRCRVECDQINEGVVALGRGLRLIAAVGLIHPKLLHIRSTSLSDDEMLLRNSFSPLVLAGKILNQIPHVRQPCDSRTAKRANASARDRQLDRLTVITGTRKSRVTCHKNARTPQPKSRGLCGRKAT